VIRIGPRGLALLYMPWELF